MLGGARRADRVIPLNLSEWVTLFRVGVATESEPWTEADNHFAAICWATGVISNTLIKALDTAAGKMGMPDVRNVCNAYFAILFKSEE